MPIAARVCAETAGAACSPAMELSSLALTSVENELAQPVSAFSSFLVQIPSGDGFAIQPLQLQVTS